MKFSINERKRMVDLAKEFGFELSFDEEINGILVEDQEGEVLYQINDFFPELDFGNDENIETSYFELEIAIKPVVTRKLLWDHDDEDIINYNSTATEAA